jgi:WXG100 family type VII secretion target
MTQSTKATPAEIHSAADRHRASADAFRQDNRNVRNEVDGLLAINRGDLMVKLDELQNEWSENVDKVIAKLDEMAGYLDEVANQIQARDADAGSGLR